MKSNKQKVDFIQSIFEDAKNVSEIFTSKWELGSIIFQISLQNYNWKVYFITLREISIFEIFEKLGKVYTDGVFANIV